MTSPPDTIDGVIHEPWWWQAALPTEGGSELPTATDVLVIGSSHAGFPRALEGLQFRTQPFCSVTPRFLPVVGSRYRFRDWLDLRLDR